MLSVKNIPMAVIVLAAFFFSCGDAFAAFDPKSYVVVDGLLYTVDANGQKKQFEGAEVVEEETAGGKIYWLAGDPEADGMNEGLYKGWKSGIYFFGGDGKFISLLEKKHADRSYVQFSPDGKQFILSSGTYVDREYLLYEFDGLKLQRAFGGISGVWIGPFRFAYTLIDESKNARHKDADFPGWLTVVVYDSAVDLLTTVLEATETEDFMMDRLNDETDELVVTKFSVKDKKDWGDEEKINVESIRVPIPAAG